MLSTLHYTISNKSKLLVLLLLTHQLQLRSVVGQDGGIALLRAYCQCKECCGPPPAITAAGTVPVEGRTIAAPRHIPLGTRVEVTIPGRWTNRVFVVEDRTAKRINGWDLYLRTHKRAKEWGRKEMRWRTIR